MKRSTLLLSLFVVPLALLSCDFLTETPPAEVPQAVEEPSSTAPEVSEEDLVTKNVTYTGILEEGGVTIYQEGSHRLMLSDGKMVLLKSPADAQTSLSLYTGKLVRVKGDVMPTVEAGGTIMEVKEIHLIRRETDAEGNEHEVLRILCGGVSKAGCPENLVCELEEDGTGVCMEELVGGSVSSESSSSVGSSESSSDSSVASTSSSFVSPSSASASSATTSSSSVSSTSSSSSSNSVSSSAGSMGATYERAVEMMIKEEYTADRWTQEYCTSHVGFCVPVHKNWYYKSFGAMSTVLWHVEIGAVDVQSTGDGPIVVELKSGDVVGLGVGDSDVRVVGERAIGYRSFSDNRHIEISGPKDLREPVEYITKGLTRTEAAGE